MSVQLRWSKNSIVVLVCALNGSFSWDSWGPHFFAGGNLLGLKWVGCPTWVSLSFFLWILNYYLTRQIVLRWSLFNSLLCSICIDALSRMSYTPGIKQGIFSAPCFKTSLRKNRFWISLKVVALFLEISVLF